jgi:WD40 repeat protein
VIRTARGFSRVAPAFSHDGKLLASAGRNAIEVWNASDGNSAVPKILGDIAKDEIHGVAVSPDGKWFLTKSADSGTIQIWDSAGQMKRTIKSNRWGGRYPIFSRDSRHFFGGALDTIALVRWDFPGGVESARYTFAEPAADQIAILNIGLSDDGKRLAAITQTANRPGRVAIVGGGGQMGAAITITVWDTATTKRLSSIEENEEAFMSYGAFSPDLHRYFLNDKAISLNGGPGHKLDLPAGASARQAAVSPDGRLVAQMLEVNAQKLVNGQPTYTIESRGVIVHETATGKGLFTLPTGYCSQIAFSPDSRDLIVVGKESIARWDLTTRMPIVRHKSPGRFVGSYGPGFASSLTITPDGMKATTGHIDTTALVWDMSAPRRVAKGLSDREREAPWNDLAGTDAGKAYAAIWTLEDDVEHSVALLKARLRPVVGPKTDHVLRLIARLRVESFADREAAEKELRALGEMTVSNLRAALKQPLPAEQKRRLERLLAEATSPVVAPGERLQQVRAIAVLEHIGSKEAEGLLKELAGGLPEARLTREAAEALARLQLKSR